MGVKYPKIVVKLNEVNDHAFNLSTFIQKAMKDAKIPIDEIRVFAKEVSGANYQEVLAICAKWVVIS